MNKAMFLSVGDKRLLIEALTARANRHDSEGRANPRNARIHDATAVAMRELADRIRASLGIKVAV